MGEPGRSRWSVPGAGLHLNDDGAAQQTVLCKMIEVLYKKINFPGTQNFALTAIDVDGGFLFPARVAFVVLFLASLIAGVGHAARFGHSSQALAASLESLAGEYTDPAEPYTPLSFYVQNGKLIFESERAVPTELRQTSPTQFAVPETRIAIHFMMDDAGRPESVTLTDQPQAVYRRTGEPVRHVFHDYERSEAMIPVRDGIKLHAVILKPADIAQPLPFLIERTPYGVDMATRSSFFRMRPELARDGYIYVGEAIRGPFKSEGEFVMSRPLADHHDPKAIDESTDAYDTVEWLLKNVQGNNGRAGL